MKFAIAGAGAIGSYLGGMLFRAGHGASLLARGPHLQAVRERGLRVIRHDDEFTVPIPASDRAADIGPVDVVVITAKAHSVESIAAAIDPLLKPETAVISCQNGLPWWYFRTLPPPLGDIRLASLDPRGVINDHISTDRVLGCVWYPSLDILEPGVIELVPGNDSVTIGEPAGGSSPRVEGIVAAFSAAGLNARVSTDIRWDIWDKTIGAGIYNTLGALTRTNLADMRASDELRPVARRMMEEVNAVAVRCGIEPFDVVRKVAPAPGAAAHKMSMHQDLELGRELELEGLLGVLLDLGKHFDIAMPLTDSLYACARLLSRATRQGVAAS